MPRPAILLALVLLLASIGALFAFPNLSHDPHNDFVAYWAAGRLTLEGGNPYGAADLLHFERSVGWAKPAPLMLWNPPWMLSALLAFAPVSFSTARSMWMVVQLALSLGSGIALWRFFRGPANRELWAVVLTAAFAPLAMSLKYGQIGPLCLLGLTGFLVLQSQRRDLCAGAVLSLAALKPHLVYAVWPAVVVWSVAAGRFRVLLGLLAAMLMLSVFPVVVNPRVYSDFLQMIREPPPTELADLFITRQDSPTFGWQLRKLLAPDLFALQYVPTALGLVWLAWYGCHHRRAWDWAERLPVLLLASVATAAYGAWPADSLLFLPAVMAVAAEVAKRGDRRAVVSGLAVFAALTIATYLVERQVTSEAYVWLPPCYLAAYCRFRHFRSRETF